MGSSDHDVNYLLKKYLGRDVSQYKIIDSLKQRGKNDEEVQRILSEYNSERKRVREFAKKVRNKMELKYADLSLTKQIEKINDYRKKYKFDNIETEKLVDIIFNMRDIQLAHREMPYNEVTRFWGWQPKEVTSYGEMKIDQQDAEAFDTILALHDKYSTLHDRVMSQSIDYQGSTPVKVTFERTKVDIYSCVHPIVVAMFLPKIRVFEERMLLASFGELVYTLGKQKTELTNQMNVELFQDINQDESYGSVIGKKFRPGMDTLDRFALQIELWKSVYALRNNNYCAENMEPIDFKKAVDKCRDNLIGSAWEMNVKDEGMAMRKLLNAFSLAPTYIQTTPQVSHGYNEAVITPNEIDSYTRVNLITYRIRPSVSEFEEQQKLTEAFSRVHTFKHKNKMIQKKLTILYSKGVLVFYIPRRKQNAIDLKKIFEPYKFTSMPVTQSRWQNLDKTPVLVDYTIGPIGTQNQVFNLKSVVAIETRRTDDAIIGSCAMVVFGREANSIVHYSPFDYGAGKDIEFMKSINESNTDSSVITFESKSRTNGTLFIYTDVEGGNN